MAAPRRWPRGSPDAHDKRVKNVSSGPRERSSFEDPRADHPYEKHPRAFKGTSRFPRPPTLRAIVASSLATDVGALLFRLDWPLELSSLPRGNFEGPKPRSGLIRTFGFRRRNRPPYLPEGGSRGMHFSAKRAHEAFNFANQCLAKFITECSMCQTMLNTRRSMEADGGHKKKPPEGGCGWGWTETYRRLMARLT